MKRQSPSFQKHISIYSHFKTGDSEDLFSSYIAQRYEPKKQLRHIVCQALEENEHELKIVSHIVPLFKDKGAGYFIC